MNGTVKVGGIFKDETAGDLSVMPETFNIYEGFTISGIDLNGTVGRRGYYRLDVREVNQESARGIFSFRVPSRFNMFMRYDRHRQLFDPAGQVESVRKNLRGGFVLTPSADLKISANIGNQKKTGSRMSYLPNEPGFLGSGYDNNLTTGRVEIAGNRGGRSLAAAYDFSTFSDDNLAAADRSGGVFSVRLNGPCYLLPDVVSHLVRASYGKQKLTAVGTDYELGTFQYLGVVKPAPQWRLKYGFNATTVDDKSTDYKTDEVRNDFDAVWYGPQGSVNAGYGRVIHDSWQVTTANVWRLGGTWRIQDNAKVRVGYDSNRKTDEEQTTLLKDMEASRFSADLEIEATDELSFGGGYMDRQRSFPLVGVETTGKRYRAFSRLELSGWGSLNVDYIYSDDDYTDFDGNDDGGETTWTHFRADNSTVTGRVDVDTIRNLKLSFGATYLDIGKDLDIEKSILSFAGHYDIGKDYFFEAKYNVFNYDDYILLDRYYTANVVWVNFGYRLSVD
ncbi:hypothetical protein COW53_02515 [bacterium CG17_big_fil_post_rev_8_21_14_2_50_64_8]|nr:MAG: hypothetical protein COW53_02515 [bacterium CG17_big_fil_post_rev_8_21_14_2_50_64_8]